MPGTIREVLESSVRRGSTSQKEALRSLIVLLSAHGHSNAAIAADLGVHVDTVGKWRTRFHRSGIDALADASEIGSTTGVHTRRYRRGESLGLPDARRAQSTDRAMVHPRTRRANERGRYRAVGLDGTSVVERGRSQTMAVPIVDRSSRPELRNKSVGRARPVCAALRRKPVGQQRFRHLRGRKALDPSPRSLPPNDSRPIGPGNAREPRLPSRWRARIPGRLRRPQRPRVRSLRAEHGNRHVHRARRSGDGMRTVRISGPGVLDRRQRILAPRTTCDKPTDRTDTRTPSWCTPQCTHRGSTK